MNRYFSLVRKICPAFSLWRSSLAVLLTAALLGLGGCGDKGAAKNRVSGKVTFNGDPVMGTIIFRGADGKEASGSIMDGKYEVDNPPMGDNQILIKGIPGMVAGMSSPPPPPEMKTQTKGPEVKPSVTPPAKYANANNGLTFKVTGGKQTKDFELPP